MELWIPVTVFAAFMQNARSALQKHLKGRLTTLGATYVRFFYAWPLALAYVWGLNAWGGLALPAPNAVFLMYCVLGGISQILFTVFLMWMFSFRNFAVGTTFSKTRGGAGGDPGRADPGRRPAGDCGPGDRHQRLGRGRALARPDQDHAAHAAGRPAREADADRRGRVRPSWAARWSSTGARRCRSATTTCP